MFPRVHNLIAGVDHLDPVGEDFALGEKIRFIAPRPFDGEVEYFFGVVPKPDGRGHGQLFMDEIRGKLPADEEPLPFGGMFLSSIGRTHMGAG